MQKRYRANLKSVAHQFVQNGVLRFKLGYTVPGPAGGQVIRGQKSSPTISIKPADVVGVTNSWAQRCIETFMVPLNTRRNGKLRLPGPMFLEVTDATTISDVDVDLDSIFVSHEQSK